MLNIIRTILLFLIFTFDFLLLQAQPIDREALVRRHTINITRPDALSSLSVGNGNFAFTADITGLQSFPDYYKAGVPLGTQSVWGWHSFPNKENYRFEEALKEFNFEGKKVTYAVQWSTPERNKKAGDYFRQNPHRLQLGNIGFEIVKKDGSVAVMEDIKNIRQQLDMWTGTLKSFFTIDDEPVEVTTYAHQQQDMIGVRVASTLISKGRLRIRLHFPYPSNEFKDAGVNDANPDKHISLIENQDSTSATISHTLDTTKYFVHAMWRQSGKWRQQGPHNYILTPGASANAFEAVFLFSPYISHPPLPTFIDTRISSEGRWQQFWKSGGAVDLSGSNDGRAFELERRIVLSQYLTRIQCASAFPPQETGLTFNSWFGKPHLEMHWWHAAHFALWGRTDLLEKSLDWYFIAAKNAGLIAKRQGYQGIRWQKMTDNQGRETASSVGAFLIWQQPHFIYMAELVYRNKQDKKVLEKYKDLVFATADFMASFPSYDKEHNRYNLGKGLIPAQESFDPTTTYNPTYELSYWRYGLSVAQQWRERLGLPRDKKWDNILDHLAPLPKAGNVYLATESTPDCYKNERYIHDHPAVLAAYSTLPRGNYLDTTIMKNTLDTVWKVWKWETTWGWDYPLIAMTATRLHMPEKAIASLMMPVQKNTYLANGHNFQDQRLTIYLPGNGGLLSAIAMMCAGYDGNTSLNPGFPQDGSWRIRWEGLKKMP